jgi:hypothetical protein
MWSVNHFAFASPAATATATNQTGNQTGANATTTAGGEEIKQQLRCI